MKLKAQSANLQGRPCLIMSAAALGGAELVSSVSDL